MEAALQLVRRILCLGCLLLTVAPSAAGADLGPDESALANWGRSLFHDPRLSADGTVSCASCHAGQRAWTEDRPAQVTLGVSAGVAKRSGSRNAPSLAYVALVPPLQRESGSGARGGWFWDGRSATLDSQAAGPLLHPDEMALPDAAALLQRLRDDPAHAEPLVALFDATSLQEPAAALIAVGKALAAYQRSPEFMAFDSRYDRYLRGEYQPTRQELLGMGLFFSPEFTNCNRCHQLYSLPGRPGELFTNHRYENIGVPRNTRLAEQPPDAGLGAPTGGLPGAGQLGRFRVPGLRNVAVTAPYMHNGVFPDLRTVLRFYNHYLQRGSRAGLDPGTGQPWGAPELADNLALTHLQHGLALDEPGLSALESFLHMLTDHRFEAATAPVASQSE